MLVYDWGACVWPGLPAAAVSSRPCSHQLSAGRLGRKSSQFNPIPERLAVGHASVPDLGLGSSTVPRPHFLRGSPSLALSPVPSQPRLSTALSLCPCRRPWGPTSQPRRSQAKGHRMLARVRRTTRCGGETRMVQGAEKME